MQKDLEVRKFDTNEKLNVDYMQQALDQAVVIPVSTEQTPNITNQHIIEKEGKTRSPPLNVEVSDFATNIPEPLVPKQNSIDLHNMEYLVSNTENRVNLIHELIYGDRDHYNRSDINTFLGNEDQMYTKVYEIFNSSLSLGLDKVLNFD